MTPLRLGDLSRRNLLKSALLSAIGMSLPETIAALDGDSNDTEYQNFVHPPDGTRPWVYWYFMDGNLTAEGMTADLEAMKRAGIGGGVYLEVDIGIARGPVQFMSEDWQRLVSEAFAHADELGLEIALAAGAGWCGAGGPWVKPEESMQFLITGETRVHGPSHFDAQLARPQPRTPFFGEETLTPELHKIWQEFYIDDFVLAFPAPAGNARIGDLAEKALYTRGSYSSQILGPFTTRSWVRPFLPSNTSYPVLAAEDCITQNQVRNLTSSLGPGGHLQWDVPAGDWIILRAGRSITAQTTRPAPRPGLGFETDKFSREAIDHHFDAYYAKLLKRIGSRRHPNSGLTTLHYDSWEMSSQNWTPHFQDEFQKRRRYDPVKFLPAFGGYVVDDEQTTERFLWDVRQTAQELVIANQALRLRELGHQNGLQLALEPYDLNPCSDLELGSVADVPMAEFWSRFGEINTDWSVVESTSIAHTNGRGIVAAEAFTAESAEHWLQHPASMKNQGDWAFCAGINRIVFHRFQAQPIEGRYPGMTMGPDGGYGVHWDRTQTWWDMVPAYHLYLSRCQSMLRRGLFVADVLYLIPEGAPHVFLPPPSAFLPGDMPDRRGYNFDGCSPGTLIASASVKDGDIIFPDGMNYRLLVLPHVETMTPQLLRKIADLVEQGASVIGMPPRSSPSLSDYPQGDTTVQQLAAKLWGDQRSVTARKVGSGTVWFDDSAARLRAKNPLQDAQWIWADAPSNEKNEIILSRTFVIENADQIDVAQIAITASPAYELSINGRLVGRGSDYHKVKRFDVTFLLAEGKNEVAVAVPTTNAEHPVAPGVIAALVITRAGHDEIINTDALWNISASSHDEQDRAVPRGGFNAKPWNLTETSLEEATLYPSFRVTARRLAQRGVEPDFDGGEGIRFIHRRDGDEDIFFVANRENHLRARTCAFRVSGSRPEWWNPITGERRFLPEFEEKDHRTWVPIRLEAFESGFIIFRRVPMTGHFGKVNFPQPKTFKTIVGPWQVSFDPRWGGPASVTFAKLEDWSQRPETEIRYYSGKATYSINFDCGDVSRGGPSFLKLGQVCNMASARLNGSDLGTAWCHPWRLNVPAGMLKEKANKLEIVVANLWVNRLIRDSGLPEEKRLTAIPGNPLLPGDALQPSGLLGPVTIEVA